MDDETRQPGSTHGRPSRLYLEKFPSPEPTILEHLIARFPRVDPDTWRVRVARGLVTLSDGTKLRENTPYRHGLTVHYWKEVPSEPPPSEEPQIIYSDNEILVADKPHGMPVIPTGDHVRRSMLYFLERITGLKSLSTLHRLDRDTAGLVLLSVNPVSRARYHQLFAHHTIEREYFAVAHLDVEPGQSIWVVRNKLEQGDPWYTRRVGHGTVNAVTTIELVRQRAGLGLFRLVPRTGKKHQLRVHMASIGFPILGDCYYPSLQPRNIGTLPLQLLANRLKFSDPLTGLPRNFGSNRTLQYF